MKNKNNVDIFTRKMFCTDCADVEWHSIVLKKATDSGVVFLKCCQKHNTESYKELANYENWELETLPVKDYNAIILDRVFI